MITRTLVQKTFSLAAMGAILFHAADDWRLPQGWVFLEAARRYVTSDANARGNIKDGLDFSL